MKLCLQFAMVICVAATAVADEPIPRGPRSANTPYIERAAETMRQWEIKFPDDITTEEYARQIDHFQIEIGAVAKGGKIEYVSQVSQRKPTKRVGNQSTDYRLHIPWTKGNLHAADRKLLAKVGINSQNKELQHYFPAATQALMTRLEQEYAGRAVSEIKRTRFEIHPLAKGDGYEFVVVEQDPPRPKEAARQPASGSKNPAPPTSP